MVILLGLQWPPPPLIKPAPSSAGGLAVVCGSWALGLAMLAGKH